jgi:WXG100 family type VII secretion target
MEVNEMAEEIRANYEELDQAANRFAGQSQVVQQMLQKVQSSLGNLENGGWIGEGANAFFGEMHGQLLPASQRLQQALDEANQVTRQIMQKMRQAEEEARSLFS